MAQSRLTSNGGTLKILNPQAAQPAIEQAAPEPQTATQPPNHPVAVLSGSGVEPLTADFFRGLIGENTKQITGRMDAMAGDVSALTKSVKENRDEIDRNTKELTRQGAAISAQGANMRILEERMSRIEAAPRREQPGVAIRSAEYLKARRSILLWPIDQSSEDSMWNGVGEFIHDALNIREDDVCQEDIESIIAVPDPKFPAGNLTKEVVVTFFCHRKRDVLMSGVSNLASRIDRSGKPTAGVRLEIPPELDGTFKLLARFGTKMRARHGEGTRRHIKFDDDTASLYTNIKLPGDESWSKVTADMALKDMDNTARAESADIMTRLAAKDRRKTTTGPSQRLAAPVPPRPASGPPPRPRGDDDDSSMDDGTSRSSGSARRAWRPRPEKV